MTPVHPLSSAHTGDRAAPLKGSVAWSDASLVHRHEAVAALEEAIERLDSLLADHEPAFAASLNPPVSEGELEVLRAAIAPYDLLEDLEILYRWHNGQGRNSTWPLLGGPLLNVIDAAEHTRGIASGSEEAWQWAPSWVAITHEGWQQDAVQLAHPLQGLVIDAGSPDAPTPRAESLAAALQAVCLLIEDGVPVEPPESYGPGYVRWRGEVTQALNREPRTEYVHWNYKRWREP